MVKENDIKEIRNKITNLYNQLKDKYPIKKVILYGSYAKGQANKESDIDVGIVLDLPKNTNKITINSQLFHETSKIDINIEPLCILWDEYRNHEPASILGEIIKTGIELI